MKTIRNILGIILAIDFVVFIIGFVNYSFREYKGLIEPFMSVQMENTVAVLSYSILLLLIFPFIIFCFKTV